MGFYSDLGARVQYRYLQIMTGPGFSLPFPGFSAGFLPCTCRMHIRFLSNDSVRRDQDSIVLRAS